jgi:hypothetical protein
MKNLNKFSLGVGLFLGIILTMFVVAGYNYLSHSGNNYYLVTVETNKNIAVTLDVKTEDEYINYNQLQNWFRENRPQIVNWQDSTKMAFTVQNLEVLTEEQYNFYLGLKR